MTERTQPERRPRAIKVLLVEDDEGDVILTREVFQEYLNNQLDVVNDGDQALAYLRSQPPYTDAPTPDLCSST